MNQLSNWRTHCFVLTTFHRVIDSPFLHFPDSSLYCSLTSWPVLHWNGTLQRRWAEEWKGEDERKKKANWCNEAQNQLNSWGKQFQSMRHKRFFRVSCLTDYRGTALSVCGVERGNLRIYFPDKMLHTKGTKKVSSSRGLNYMCVQTAGGLLNVTTKARNECTDETVRHFG